MRTMRCTWLVCAGVVACAGETREATGGGERHPAWSPVDACALFTREDAVRLLGGEVGEPTRGTDLHEESSGRSLSHCAYTAGATMRSASLLVRRGPGDPLPGSIEEVRAQSRAAAAGESDEDLRELAEAGAKLVEEGEPVPGVGRVAWWSRELKQLTVYVEPHWMLVITASPDREAADGGQGSAVELARLVAARL